MWMANSNSALKISQGYGFKPGFGHFSIKSGSLGPRGPCDHEFLRPTYLRVGANLAPAPFGPKGPMVPMGSMGTHGPVGEF